jgi:hypothetical protein
MRWREGDPSLPLRMTGKVLRMTWTGLRMTSTVIGVGEKGSGRRGGIMP